MKQYILLVSGPLCSGKTSLAEVFMKKETRVFRASFDTIKRLISNFDAEKNRGIVTELVFSLSKEAFKKNFSLYVEGSASIFEKMREFYKTLAEENNIIFLEINLEAPIEVLKKRLEERVKSGKALVVTNMEQFMRRYNLYIEHKDSTLETYDTSKNTPEEIYLSVIKKLSSLD